MITCGQKNTKNLRIGIVHPFEVIDAVQQLSYA